MSKSSLERIRKRIAGDVRSTLTPLEHYFLGSTMSRATEYGISEQEYKDNPLKPLILIEAGETVDGDIIRIVNEERERVGKDSSFATAMMFGLPVSDQAYIKLEPLYSDGVIPAKVKLTEIRKNDGTVVTEGLEGYRVTPEAQRMIDEEFPVLAEGTREGDVSLK